MKSKDLVLYKEIYNKEDPLPLFEEGHAKKLLDRINRINLYAHSYSFLFNFDYGNFGPLELLDFANKKNLKGIMIDIRENPRHCLLDMAERELINIKLHATKLSLKINLEISSTTKSDINKSVKIASILGVENIRIYSRYGGRVSEIIEKNIRNLQYAVKVAEKHNMFFVLEQHEALKSNELVKIAKGVGSPRLNLLYDTANMLNANEHPLEALQNMSTFIKQVHIKDVRKEISNNGCGQFGAGFGKGDLPLKKMLFDLLMLGTGEPQVNCFGLQEVVGFKSPPYRFSGEENDPIIPHRKIRRTDLNDNCSLDTLLTNERKNASAQVKHIKALLLDMKHSAEKVINAYK
jgi:sugar phosphate isomerase/epimerase